MRRSTMRRATCVQVVEAGAQAVGLAKHPAVRRFDARAKALGFDHWTYSAGPTTEPTRPLRPPTTITTYPEAHTRTFFARRLDRTNPGRAYWRAYDEPATYAEIREAASPPGSGLADQLALNRLHDVTRGLVIPLSGVFGMIGGVGLAYRGAEHELEALLPDLAGELVVAGQALHRAVLRSHGELFLAGRLPYLTPRQREVLRRMAHGFGHKEIASRLDLSLHTVDKHVARIKSILGAATLAHATALAARWGLLDSSRPS